MSVAMTVCHLVMTSLLYNFHFHHYFWYWDVGDNKWCTKRKTWRDFILFHFGLLSCSCSDWPCRVITAEQYNELELSRVWPSSYLGTFPARRLTVHNSKQCITPALLGAIRHCLLLWLSQIFPSKYRLTTFWFLLQYTECNRRNGPDFDRVFLMLNYTEKVYVLLGISLASEV